MPANLELKLEPRTAEPAPPPVEKGAAQAPGARPEERKRPNKKRLVKIGVSVALILAGGYGIFSEEHFVSTENAIVSAYVVSVRTPIDGNVEGVPAASGIRMQQGDPLGRVENPRVDLEHLENLKVIHEQAQSEADAMLAERDSLMAQRRDLLARSAAYAKAVTARLRQQSSESSRLLNAREIAVRLASSDLERGRKLREAGIISDADLEKLQAQYDVAVEEEAAQRANLAAIGAALEASQRGVHSETGVTNDVAYSQQRSDEVNLRLAEINHSLTALQAQARAAEENLEAETKHTELMSEAVLQAPISGVLWKIEAMNGERVAVGDTVAEMVDCNQGFVLAEIHQERVPDIAIGKTAKIKLSGETADRTGTVISVGGDPRKEDSRKFAAFPLQDTTQELSTVKIAMPSGGECLVGRTARILIPTTQSSIALRWVRRHF